MDLTFVLCPNIIGLLGLGILLIFTRFNFYLTPQKLKLFVAAAIVNIIIIAFEVADYILAESSYEMAYLLRRITSATGFALTPMLPLLLAMISGKRIMRWWTKVPAAVNVVLSYASIFTGHMFYIAPGNSYFRGPLFIVMVCISAFYLLMLIWISLINIQSIRSSEAVFLLCIVAAILFGNVLEIVFSFHFIIWNVCAVLLITYYLFLHIQYFKYDPLTDVYNRNMFNHELEGLGGKANVGILSFDLNGLKTVNDQQGHEKGDEYIIGAARMLSECFSGAGHLYRIGGDEFVVIMTATSERIIRQKIEELQAMCNESAISIACGYSFIDNVTDTSQMMRDADKAMYDNKRSRMANR